MDFNGKVIVLNQPTGGTSKSGNVWKKQELIIEEIDGGQYPQSMAFEIFGEERISKFNVHQGDIVSVKFNCKATSFNGRCFNQLQIWSLNKQSESQNQASVPTQQPKVQQVPVQQTSTSADDLPF